jgi:hypothetical protein
MGSIKVEALNFKLHQAGVLPLLLIFMRRDYKFLFKLVAQKLVIF